MSTYQDRLNPISDLSQPTQEPTPASTWQAVAGSPISDQLLEWPADLFALTNVIIERSELYRFALSPTGAMAWPPQRVRGWSDVIDEASRQWSGWLDDRHGELPDLLLEKWKAFCERAQVPMSDVAEGHDSPMCEALMTLHAIADEACAGLGVALDRSDAKGCLYRARGRELLARTGSLSRIPSHFLRVLPKVRTPPTGSSMRSLSRYASLHGPGVEARWYKLPARRPGADPRARHANLLLLPWPLRVRESDFHPVEGSVQRQAKEPFGLYEFAPSEKLDLDLLRRVIEAARDEVDSVDVVMLPESAVDETELDDLEALLERLGVVSLISGVRRRSGPGQLPGNWVHTGISPGLEKGRSPLNSGREHWFRVCQNKHHPWSLDEVQILQYHLGGALHPHVRWWEAIEVPRRAVRFIVLGDEITMVSLVCEDLAQIDDVAEVIRSVGPTFVFAPLLDGPQLTSRWAARYASVLADDPGSAVLTLTSYGMVQRCRPHGLDPSRVIALWKDPVRGFRQIPLEAGAQGVLLTVCGGRATRRSADGRWPVDNASEYFDVATFQIRVRGDEGGSSDSYSETRAPRVLETDEVTILTGWAEGVAEVLANAPERMEPLMADAKAGAPWRAALRVADLSPRLSEAIDLLGRVVQEVAPSGTTFDSLIGSCQEHRPLPGEPGLESLVRRVLRSTLDQRRNRQVAEGR
jgi:hypothetical protein